MRIILHIDLATLLTAELLKRESGVVPAVRVAVTRLVNQKLRQYHVEANLHAGKIADSLESSGLVPHGMLQNCLTSLTLRTPGGWDSVELRSVVAEARKRGDQQSHISFDPLK